MTLVEVVLSGQTTIVYHAKAQDGFHATAEEIMSAFLIPG